jgi:hypothetical protein
MILKGETLYILEVESAGYAYFAANEAEKGAAIKIVNVRGFGAFGRVYLSGEEKDVIEAQKIIEAKLADVTGREIKSKK